MQMSGHASSEDQARIKAKARAMGVNVGRAKSFERKDQWQTVKRRSRVLVVASLHPVLVAARRYPPKPEAKPRHLRRQVG